MLVALVLAAVAIPACASTSRGDTAGGAAGAAARAVPGTTIVLADRVLRVDELRPLVAFGYDTREQPVLDPKQFTLANLRGPCGATVETPFFTTGVLRVFRSTVTLVIEVVAEPGEQVATSFVQTLRADLHSGCPAFEEQVGGAPSKITLQAPVAVPEGDHVAWSQKVTPPDGSDGYRYVVVLRNGGRLLLLVVLAIAPLSAEAMAGLTDRAAAKL